MGVSLQLQVLRNISKVYAHLLAAIKRAWVKKHSVVRESCEIQGDQKVCVQLMIKTQKVKSNVQSVPRLSPDIIDTPNRVLEDRARFTFRMYSVMVIFKSLIVWGFLRVFVLKSPGAQRLFHYLVEG
jgi:hypothetical protein